MLVKKITGFLIEEYLKLRAMLHHPIIQVMRIILGNEISKDV